MRAYSSFFGSVKPLFGDYGALTCPRPSAQVGPYEFSRVKVAGCFRATLNPKP